MTKTKFAKMVAAYALLVGAAVLFGVAAMYVIFGLGEPQPAPDLMRGVAAAIAGLAVGIASHAIALESES